MLDRSVEYQKMAEAETDFWWYKILHKMCIREIKKNFNSKNISIFDAGCGTGGLMQKLNTEGYPNVSGIDASDEAVEFCKKKNLNSEREVIQNISKILNDKKFDVIICNDVMYFLTPKEQIQFMNDVYDKLNENGIAIINFPALKAFSGNHDMAVGITERFSKEMVKNLIIESNLKLKLFRFWPFSLSPIIFFTRLIQRKKAKLNSGELIKSDIEMPAKWINILLYWIVLFEISIFKFYPFGSSIFITLKKQ